MIKVKFKHIINGEKIKIIAQAKDVDSYGAIGLRLKFLDSAGEPITILFNRKLFDEIEEVANDLLYERKYAKELEF